MRNTFKEAEVEVKVKNYFVFRYNCINIFLSKLEIINLFGYNKYRSTLFYKITIKDIKKEWEWEESDIF